MSAGKELLAEILEGISLVQTFLQSDLKQVSLSSDCQVRREVASEALENIINKIQHAHPSIRPRVNTPGYGGKKPPLPPPAQPPAPPVPEEEGEELYDEAMSAVQPPDTPQDVEDYLSFEPSHLLGEEPQEMYESMQAAEDQELYETPIGGPGGSQEAESVENYEDPILSRPSTASLPSQSQENSGSGAEYAETMVQRVPGLESTMEMSVSDWSNVYSMPAKGEKLKVSQLQNVAIKGYLDKLGGRNHKQWQRRYCVLSGPLMYFYEKEGSKTYNNLITLLSFTASLAENMTNPKKGQFSFKLTQTDSSTGKNKDYYFRANRDDVRNKWLGCISRVGKSPQPSPSPVSKRNSSSTLPRMPTRTSVSTFSPTEDVSRNRTHSLGEEPQELYEDMAVKEDMDEYVAVSPTENAELESSEEYVDVVPQGDIQEDYEDTTNFQQPPPPLSPPPGPPSELFTPPEFALPPQPPRPAQVTAPKAPAPPPPTEVDTNRIYDQPTSNGIRLEKVFVSLWDFAAGDTDELALHRGDLVYVNTPLDTEEWWYGEVLDPHASKKLGQAGYFPKSYSTIAFEAATS